MKDYDLLVNIEPEILYPGDTASVVIKKLMLQDSSLVDFDSSQTFEVAKLDGCIWGDIFAEDSLGAYFYGVHQPIKFVVDTSAEIIDSLASDSGKVLISVGVVPDNQKAKLHPQPNDITDCFTGILEIQDNKESQAGIYNPLEIIEPTSILEEKFITSAPAMPVLTVKAKMNNYHVGEFIFNWKYIQSWTNNAEIPKRKVQETFEGNSPGFLSNISTWNIDFSNDIIGGDKDTLYVYVYDGPKVYTRAMINPYKILGTHLSPQDVRSDLTIHEQIVVYLESFPKWQHFNNNGFPIFGPPHGYGLMEIDPPRNNQQIWNWLVNRAEGRARLEEKRLNALGYPENVRNGNTWYIDRYGKKHWPEPIYPHTYDWYPNAYPGATDFNEEQLWKETHQRYRGGNYFRWEPMDPEDRSGSGEWIVSPSRPHNRGGEAWQIYLDILSGIYPSGWNE